MGVYQSATRPTVIPRTASVALGGLWERMYPDVKEQAIQRAREQYDIPTNCQPVEEGELNGCKVLRFEWWEVITD